MCEFVGARGACAIREVLHELYADFLQYIENALHEVQVEALVLMATLEGLGLFVGRHARWKNHADPTIAALRALLRAQYPQLAKDCRAQDG